MNPTQVNIPAAEARKKFGLYPAKIGTTMTHRLGIAMPLTPPAYSTVTAELGALAPVRTRARVTSPHFEYAKANGELVPVKALPGASVQLDVQDLTGVESELQKHTQWTCSHPDCVGKRWPSRQAMRTEHGDETKLRQLAEQDPRGGRAHCYVGVIEVAAKPATKNDKGQVIEAAVETTTVMLVSDEE